MSDPSKPAVSGTTGSAATAIAPDAAAAASKAAAAASKAADAVKTASSTQNPALKAMGLPRFRLPSRNWMMFLSITGSIAAGITYDRWQTRKVKEKWCKLVSHIKDEPLEITSLPRTVTIYLSAPPGDGLRAAREHFHDYVKPILVAAALDWDVVEGRKEGDVRYKTAERIRRRRRTGGEGTPMPVEEHNIEDMRKNMGVHKFEGVAGDLVIGRHTWKEYIRGLHEGWLGPVDTPEHVDIAMGTLPEPATTGLPEPATAAAAAGTPPIEPVVQTLDSAIAEPEDTTAAKSTPEQKEDKKAEDEEEEKPKPRQPPPYITPEAYTTALASRQLPELLEPTAPISCPHILGFRNTPIRLYRYFTRRRLADEIGRQVAAAIMGSSRSFDVVSEIDEDSPSGAAQAQPEQVEVLKREERDWWKTVRQPRKEFEESVLIEPMVFDDRITSRMRKFELTSDEEQRANAIAAGHDSSVRVVESSTA